MSYSNYQISSISATLFFSPNVHRIISEYDLKVLLSLAEDCTYDSDLYHCFSSFFGNGSHTIILRHHQYSRDMVVRLSFDDGGSIDFFCNLVLL